MRPVTKNEHASRQQRYTLLHAKQTTCILVVCSLGFVGIRTATVKAQSCANVLDFGAQGNGSTPDEDAIEAAIAAVSSNGVVFFPPGRYLLTRAIHIQADNLTLQGLSGVVLVADPPVGEGTAGAILGKRSTKDVSAVSGPSGAGAGSQRRCRGVCEGMSYAAG